MVINMKITVLAGGTSTERDVSLVTGSMIYKSLAMMAQIIQTYLPLRKTGVKAFRQSPARILISGR